MNKKTESGKKQIRLSNVVELLGIVVGIIVTFSVIPTDFSGLIGGPLGVWLVYFVKDLK